MYTFPTVAINSITYTARRWGQFPTITYLDDSLVTAGNEKVILSDDLTHVLVLIDNGNSTNTQVAAALAKSWAVRPGTPQNNSKTALTSGINNSATAIPVASTAAFPATGFIIIENEVIHYSAKNASSFTADFRGFSGTAVSHANAKTVYITQVLPSTTVQSLLASDLLSAVIAGGQEATTNAPVSVQTLSGAADVPAPNTQSAPSYRGIPVLALDPVNPQEGDVWYNSVGHVMKYYDGTSVQTVAI